MKRLIYISILSLFVISCSTTRKSNTGESPTVKRTLMGDPKFIESISITPGEDGYDAGDDARSGGATKKRTRHAYSGNIENSSALQFKYAIMLGEEVEALSNTSLLQFIDEWYGTRYRYGGSTRDGIDCSGFSCLLMSSVFGKKLSRTAREQFEECQKIPREALQEGDLVFFNTRGGVSHVGVYLTNNKFVHASTSSGVVISDLDEEYYRKRFVGAGRLMN